MPSLEMSKSPRFRSKVNGVQIIVYTSDFSVFINQTSRTVLPHKTWFCPFFCLQEPIYKVLVIFLFVLKLGVYVRLVKSLLILTFYLSKQLKESSRTQILGVKRL